MWYLVKTKYGREPKAMASLKRRGFETYYPCIDITKLSGGKRTTVTEPAFRGYIFVNVDLEYQQLGFAKHAPEVLYFIRFGDNLMEIPWHVIENIKKTFERMAVSTAPERGDIVRVTSGPFKDFEAIFQEPDGSERSKILLNLLNQQQLLIIDNKSISAAN